MEETPVVSLPSPNSLQTPTLQEFNSLFNHLNTTFFSSTPSFQLHNKPITRAKPPIPSSTPSFQLHNKPITRAKPPIPKNSCLNEPNFLSTSISLKPESQIPGKPTCQFWLKPATRGSPAIHALFKNLSIFERAFIGAAAGGIAGAFTYACLHPLDTVKTRLQAKGASEIYDGAIDAIVKTFKSRGISGFYNGFSAVVVGSTFSSAVYFGTCEFGKSVLSNFQYPLLLIPPTAGAMGNIVSSAIMVPKELITQRMQTGAKGRSWEVLLRILEKDGILGLYAGYSATLLRNLPAGVLSYSSFEYLKAAVLMKNKKSSLEPFESVCCGALAGAISASLTTPLDVIKTRLMTQAHGEAVNKVAVAMYGGVSATVRQILKEEGLVGFTRGMGPRVLHSACFSAIGYFSFETARLTILHHYLRQKEFQDSVQDSSTSTAVGQ